MKLRDVASDSFYLLQVDSDPEEALRLLDEGPDVSHVIVIYLDRSQRRVLFRVQDC